MPSRSAQPVRSLYIHVPFCAHKCEYCAFYSEPSRGTTIQRYVDALIQEIELAAPELQPQTVFFGGGPPFPLTPSQWESILPPMYRLKLRGPRGVQGPPADETPQSLHSRDRRSH